MSTQAIIIRSTPQDGKPTEVAGIKVAQQIPDDSELYSVSLSKEDLEERAKEVPKGKEKLLSVWDRPRRYLLWTR